MGSDKDSGDDPGEREESSSSDDDDDGESGVESEHNLLEMGSTKEKIIALKERRNRMKINVLLTAAFAGDVAKVKNVVASVSINEGDTEGRTALHIACCEGHVELVQWLLDNSADVFAKDKNNNTPLNDAVRHNQDEVAQLLRKHFPELGYDLAGCAIAVEMCETAFRGDRAHIKRLLANKADINSEDYDGRTALHLASCEGHTKIVELLISNNANLECKDRFGGTPLEDAVRHDQKAIQALLRKTGSSLLKGGTDYRVKLCNCASSGQLDEIRVLCMNGVDLATGDYDSRTALHLAAAENQLGVLEFLLKDPGVQVNAVDRFGGTALEDAIRHGKATAQAVLLEAGGLRSDNPAMAEIVRKQESERVRSDKEERLPRILAIAHHSPETKALAYMTGVLLPAINQEKKALLERVSALFATVRAALHFFYGPNFNLSLQGESGSPLRASNVTDHANSDKEHHGAAMDQDGGGANGRFRRSASTDSASSQLTNKYEGGGLVQLDELVEETTALCVDLKSQAIRVRTLMRGELEDTFIPVEIACNLWRKARSEIEEEGLSLIEKLNEVVVLVRAMRKSMREIQKLSKRKSLANRSESRPVARALARARTRNRFGRAPSALPSSHTSS
ncbi:ankyrin repeat-containing domain protein [Baffinella frigidus]|nr:ankyrin repeat-containing domain protein [Cryptophyta sp. CCMP2293]